METPASVKKHPVHPMLVGIPIGLWVFSLVCDLIAVALQDRTASVVAFYAMVGGLVGAICAAVPGFIDFMSLPEDSKAKRIALWHMGINIAVITLFAVNIGLRVPDIAAPPLFAIWLSGVAVAMLVVSGWLGGELVHILGISVVEPAGLSATPGEAERERVVARKRPAG